MAENPLYRNILSGSTAPDKANISSPDSEIEIANSKLKALVVSFPDEITEKVKILQLQDNHQITPKQRLIESLFIISRMPSTNLANENKKVMFQFALNLLDFAKRNGDKELLKASLEFSRSCK